MVRGTIEQMTKKLKPRIEIDKMVLNENTTTYTIRSVIGKSNKTSEGAYVTVMVTEMHNGKVSNIKNTVCQLLEEIGIAIDG